MIKYYFQRIFTLSLLTILTSFSFAQGFQINSLSTNQNVNYTCDSVIDINISALTNSISTGADYDIVINGANFQATQFQTIVDWGDGTNSVHYGGTANAGMPIAFSPSISHAYSSTGSFYIIVQVFNLQNNTSAVLTINTNITFCQTYIFAQVNVDCNNDGINESTLSSGVPIVVSNGAVDYSDTLSGSMVNLNGINPGTYNVTVDSFWLNTNGYTIGNISGGTIVVTSNSTTFTISITLICDTTLINYQCLSGYVYCDNNMNNVFNAGETPIANAPINVQANGINYTATSDANGYYTISYIAPNPTYAIVTINPNWMSQNGYTTNSYIFTVVQTSCASTTAPVNFAMNCGNQNPLQGCVSGYVWCDANGDGDFDTNEIPMIGAPIILQGSNLNVTVYSDSTGLYTYCGTLLNQTYAIGTVDPNWLLSHGYTISNNSYTMLFSSGLNTQPVGLGVNCGGTPNTCADLWTTVTPWIGYYQNQTNYIRVNFGNYGPGAPGNYTVTLTYPAGVTPITSSINIPGYSISGNTITWNLNSNLNAFSQNDVIYFNTPNGISSGTQHFFISTITPTGSIADCCTSNNSGTLLQIVGNSYDPNDKTVDLTTGIDHTVQDELTYTIRFQNTGTAPAQDVYIMDTLSANLDWSTISVIESTHTMHLIDLGNGVIRFDFPQIWLTDSTTNEPLSHGHVVFKIKENVGNLSGSEIFNTGHIFFDWNPAIITNTTYNINGTLSIPENTIGELVNLYPNPTSDVITISSSSEIISIQLVDMSGKLIQSTDTQSTMANLNLSTLKNGVYLLQIETVNGTVIKKVIKN